MDFMTSPNNRWFHVTPGGFFIGLLAVQVFLLLSDQFKWFAFNENTGWTVLIAVGVVCVAVLVMLFWFVLVQRLQQALPECTIHHPGGRRN
jgi:hypothetical protein